MFVVTIVRR